MKRILSIPEAGIIILCFFLITIFQTINPSFLGLGNVQSMFRSLAYSGIVGVGLAICLICGVIDLSVGAVAGLSGVVFSIILTKGYDITVAILGSLIVGILAGLLNSIMIIWIKITPFIGTISTMYIFRGFASYISDGFTIYPLPQYITKIGNAQPLGISWAFLIMIVFMVIVEILLRTTVWGLSLRATGSDEETARNTEVDVTKTRLSALLITGVLSAIAGIMGTMMLGAGVPTLGTGWEFIAITACAIGGVSLFGYSGNMIGLLFGLLTLQVIQNGIVVIGISPYIQTVVVGSILLTSMMIEVRRRKTLNLERI